MITEREVTGGNISFMGDTYHHGDLREAILAAAAETILADGGPNHLSLRALARQVGVTHTAPRHHFGDKRGVLTALATQGFVQMAEALRTAAAHGSFSDVGFSYFTFAREHPAHFSLMFQPDLTDPEDAALLGAKQGLMTVLQEGITRLQAEGRVGDPAAAGLAGWSLVHGMATLALAGNLDTSQAPDMLDTPDRDALARRAIALLFDPTTRSA